MKIEKRDLLLGLLVILMGLSVAHDYLGSDKATQIEYVGERPQGAQAKLGDPDWSGWIQVPSAFRRHKVEFGRKASP